MLIIRKNKNEGILYLMAANSSMLLATSHKFLTSQTSCARHHCTQLQWGDSADRSRQATHGGPIPIDIIQNHRYIQHILIVNSIYLCQCEDGQHVFPEPYIDLSPSYLFCIYTVSMIFTDRHERYCDIASRGRKRVERDRGDCQVFKLALPINANPYNHSLPMQEHSQCISDSQLVLIIFSNQ
jgi:hypothetical protein